MLALAAALVLAAPPAGAGRVDAGVRTSRPVVAVLYFDNQTGDPQYDVLQKGLADMMLTDLVSSDAVDVVERERLQDLIDELKLQRTKYFDPATAVRLGRMMGATHAVTGTVQEVKSQLRLSVRVIDIATDRVPVAQQVFGPRDRLFELQARLVELLLRQLDITLGARAPVKPVATVDTLLAYSRAVDAADQGDLQVASARLAEVLRRAPTLALGLSRRKAWARKLRGAADARRAQLELARTGLLARAEAVLAAQPKRLVSMGALEASRHLTYRVVQAQCLGLGLKALVTPQPVHTLLLGAEASARVQLGAYRQSLAALERELAEWRGKWQWLPDPKDTAALALLELGPPDRLVLANAPGAVRRSLGQLALLGAVDFAGGGGFSFRPTPCELDPATTEGAVRMLNEAAALLAPQGEAEVVRTLDALARGLATSGQTEAAVRTWQGVLERFPRSPLYPAVEQHLQAALDLSPAALEAAEADAALAGALERCDASATQRALEPVVARRLKDAGLHGVRPVLDGVAAACLQTPGFAPGWLRAAELGATLSARQGDCLQFAAWAEAAARLEPGVRERLVAAHPACE